MPILLNKKGRKLIVRRMSEPGFIQAITRIASGELLPAAPPVEDKQSPWTLVHIL